MSTSTIDRAGVAISGLCVIHCLLLPLATSALPLVGLLAENEMIHKTLVLLAVIPAALAFSRPSGSRLSHIIRGGALFGILVLLAGAYVEAFHDIEASLTLIGALSLASAHLMRLKSQSSHQHKN